MESDAGEAGRGERGREVVHVPSTRDHGIVAFSPQDRLELGDADGRGGWQAERPRPCWIPSLRIPDREGSQALRGDDKKQTEYSSEHRASEQVSLSLPS